ncbi:Ig-like domain-containing protein [Algiphilus sp. W345]|uniref:Ig-like domain-containing protein n=1 Tax=Banduia mediterranea TaxID=3075609 RepID=A0ABU2WGI0_9GAMM|nr:Ig-like domain-containing protein [Algiphilus sp. W345]MDT0496976.1 Ig-like domain-containing protein [Algiphilus sp. W345]
MRGFWTTVVLCAAFLAGCGGGVSSPDFTPKLTGLSVDPPVATVRIGETQTFTATGTFTTQPDSTPDSTTETVSANWSVSDESIATIDGEGTLTAVDDGSVTVTAKKGGITATATVTVSPPTLSSITITPTDPTITIGDTVSFTATGTFQDNPDNPDSEPYEDDVDVTWAGGDPAVATVDANSGVATGVGEGSTSITATSGGISASVTLTVNGIPVLTSIAVTPEMASAPLGRNVEFTATGTFMTEAGTTNTGPVDVQWSSQNEMVATIDEDNGVAHTVTQGSTEIRATNGDVVGTAMLSVTAPVLDQIVVEPDSADIPVGGEQDFTAMGVYSDDPLPRLIADPVSWSSEDTAVVTVDPASGATTTATAVAEGSTAITASSGDISGSASVTVSTPVLTDLVRVEPPVGRVVPGTSTEFKAIGSFNNGNEATIDDSKIEWSSSNVTLATIDDNGVATGIAEGEVTITAILTDCDAGAMCEATAQLVIANAVCSIPLLASEGAQVGSDVTVGCLLCSVDDEENLINDDQTDAASITIPVGLLGAGGSITTAAGSSPPYAVPFAAGTQPGFIVGHPNGQLLTLELLSQIQVSTLLNSTEQESTGDTTPLRLDLLGQNLIGDEASLLSFTATKPYNAIRLTFNSGLATALSSIDVYQACGATELPPPVFDLEAVIGVEPDTKSVLEGSRSEFVLIGRFSDGSEGPIDDSLIDWSSADPAVATINAEGFATGVAVGTTTITGTLKMDAAPEVSMRDASATLTVITDAQACTTQLIAAKGAVVTNDTGGVCLLCSVSNTDNIVDEPLDTYSTMSVPVALLQGEASVTVSLQADNAYELPFEGGDDAGFLISRPAGVLLTAEIGSQVEVSTLLNGIVQESSGDTLPLRLDLLGAQLTDNVDSDAALATIPTTMPYDSLRLTFHAGLATVLSSVQINAACATAAIPSAP